MGLIQHVRAIEDKYGRRWYEDTELDLSSDCDWKAILSIREQLGFMPLKARGNYAGNPKNWDQTTLDFVKENLMNLFNRGVFSKKDINRFFGIGVENRQWLPRTIKYLDLEDYYKCCKKVVVIDRNEAREFDSLADAAKHYKVKGSTVKRALTKGGKMKSKYRVYRYIDYKIA